uniref:cAMP-responsive element-binding protein-like 2 n=2 Tax=Dromaius novaehollandiae TaxID=8790 RepID=A0A8C4J2E5_DRONO
KYVQGLGLRPLAGTTTWLQCSLCRTGPLTYLPFQVVGGKVKKPGKRGRKPAKIDLKAKLERSRQSARECRARKKLRYQYLEELVSSRERAICALREELEMYKQWCMAMDQGKIPSEIKALLTGEEQGKAQQNSVKLAKTGKTEANSSNPCKYPAYDEFLFCYIFCGVGGWSWCRKKHKDVLLGTNSKGLSGWYKDSV